MFKRLKVSSVLLFSVIILFSAEAICEEKEKGDFRGYFMVGASSLDIDDMNERLGEKGYTEFSDSFASFGGGGFVKVSDRVMLGLEGQMFAGGVETSVIGSDNYSSRIIGGYGFFNTGYLIHSDDHLDIYPLVGIGFGAMQIKIGQTSFDKVLDTHQNVQYLNSYSFLLNAAIGADYKIKLSDNESQKKYFVIGLRGGYAFSPFDSDWYQDEFKLTGGPNGGVNGPYVCLTLGVAGVFSLKQVKGIF